MAIKNNYLYSESLAKRHILQIDSLPKEEAETYVVLSKLLSEYPKLEKKEDFSSLADLNIKFSLLSRGDKFALFASLTQIEHQALRYIFTNPYTKGVEIQREILSSGFKVDNLSFENLKASLIYQTKKENKKAIHLLRASLSCLYSAPYLSHEKISRVSVSQVNQAFETYRDNKKGELLYFGKPLKKELPPLTKYNSLLDSVTDVSTIIGYNTINSKEISDEAVAYIFEIPTLKTFKEMDVFETFLRSLSLLYQEHSLSHLGAETNVSIDYIDASHPVLLVSTLKNKGEYLAKNGILGIETALPEKVQKYFDEATLYNQEKRLNLQLDEEMTLKRFLLAHAFGLSGDDFLEISEDRDLLLEYSKSASIKAIVVACGGAS